MENLNLQEFDLAFFNDGYLIAEESCDIGITRLALIEMTHRVYDYIDNFISQFLEQCSCNNSRVDCNKGCAWCCHQSVFVMPHEAFYLLAFLKENTHVANLNLIKEKILQKNAKTAAMDLSSVLSNTEPCPFLTDNICTVYQARPMACRLFYSMDVQSCITERQNPLNLNKFARLYEFPIRAGRMINEGIGAWFTKKGLKSTEWLIESSLSLLINNEKLIYTWIKGEECFKARDLSEEEWGLLKKFDRS